MNYTYIFTAKGDLTFAPRNSDDFDCLSLNDQQLELISDALDNLYQLDPTQHVQHDFKTSFGWDVAYGFNMTDDQIKQHYHGEVYES